MRRIWVGAPLQDVALYMLLMLLWQSTNVLPVLRIIACLASASFMNISRVISIKRWQICAIRIKSSCFWSKDPSLSNVLIVNFGCKEVRVVITWHADANTNFAIFVAGSSIDVNVRGLTTKLSSQDYLSHLQLKQNCWSSKDKLEKLGLQTFLSIEAKIIGLIRKLDLQ